MEKRVISTQIQEEDLKLKKEPASADFIRIYRTGKSKGKSEGLY